MLKKFAINILLVLCSTAVALLLAEGLVRRYMPSPDYGVGKRPALYNTLFRYDAEIGWVGSPNTQSPYISKDFQVTITHDALGFRNRVPPFVAGKKNVLLLGDSYGWGWGVEDNEMASYLLSQNGSPYNVYNLSIPGYGTDQEFLTLQRFLQQHNNRVYSDVVLLFYFNDFENNGTDVSYLYPKPVFRFNEHGDLQLNNVPVPKVKIEPVSITELPPTQDILQNSQLLNFVLDNVGKIIFQHGDDAGQEAIELKDYEIGNIHLTDAILKQLNDFCRDKNMRFHVVFLMTQNTDAYPAAMIQQLAAPMKQQGIAYSYFYSKQFPRTDLWLDTHYTPYGQRLLAEHIRAVLDGVSP